MAKKMRNKSRDLTKLMEQRTMLVELALDQGKLTKKDISKATGLKISDLNNLFNLNKELYAKYSMEYRTIKDIASDNIADIVRDPNHAKNYDASKYILANYKSDFDDVLESKDDTEIEIKGAGGKSSRPVVIRFGKKQDKTEE